MASELRIFDFVLGRERALVMPDYPRYGEPESGPAAELEPATDCLVRPGAAGRRLVEDHLRFLVNRHRHRHRGRDAA